MNKKDIYEHLANIYIDASRKKKRKFREPLRFKYFFFISLAVAIILAATTANYFFHAKRANPQVALVLQDGPNKINFNFDPAKKEIYTLGLKKLNVTKYKNIALALKKDNYRDKVSLKLEFSNRFNEKSEVYLKDLPNKWQDYKIALADFKKISDWSEMTGLSLIVEEWNSTEKHGIIYIDNVRLLR